MPVNSKTIGDLIQVRRLAKKLTIGHVALKMGIAASVVCHWEDEKAHPDDRQLELLTKILGFGSRDFEVYTCSVENI